MKILFFVDHLFRAGIQTLLLNITKELLKNKDVKIHFLVFDDGKHYELEDIFESLGCSIYKVTWPHVGSLNRCIREMHSFFKKNNDYDVVHAHSSSKAVLPLYYAKKYNIPIRIAHSHNTKFQSHNPITIGVGNLLKWPMNIYANYYYACSEKAGRWLFDNWFSKKSVPIRILHNGIILDEFMFNQQKRDAIRKELRLKETTTVIGHVGRFMLQKNHKFLIDIFEAYHTINPDSKLLLIGGGDLVDKIKNYVKIKGLMDDVQFLGFITDTYRYYQSFDLFLMPSLYEGLPVVGVEAQAAGLPCVFSDTVTPEVKILKSTIFESLNSSPTAWAKKIDTLIKKNKRRDTRTELTTAGYNIENEARGLLDFYIENLNKTF